MGWRALIAAAGVALALPAAAQADATPLGLSCTPQAGVRFCQGNGSTQRVATFDGVPLDADVTLPASGDGPFPTIVMLHGWGGDKTSFESADGKDTGQKYHYNNVWFAQQGYAVLTYSARGWGNSCGAPESRTPDCLQQVQNGGDPSATGWIHLKDRRREAHDTQFLLGKLVDQGIADPNALAATGVSYGGGESVELGYLNDRTQLPDDSFAPWTSPAKKIPLHLAAAWPRWPWSDLVSSLLPNGRFLDFDNTTADKSRTPIGIPIETYIEGLFATGEAEGWIAPPGADPNADLATWNTRVMAGEPTNDPETTTIANQIYDFHQGFGCSGCGTPAPLLIQNGWTDDLFPPAEALRVYNSLRAANPNADVALQFGDLGHSRGSNKPAVDVYFNDQGNAFLASHLRGAAGGPAPGSVTTFTQTCPKTAPADGPFAASSWRAIHPGVFRFGSQQAQTVTSAGGNPATGAAIDPIANSDACKTVPDEQAQGTAVIEGPASQGFTMLGLPTVQAKVNVSAEYAQLDSRLWDVAPNGDRVLVSRGAYRLELSQDGKRITFQLHGNGWRFEPGHVPELELLGRDAPYLRPSNTPFTVTVSDVAVELPTLERPGAARGTIVRPVISQGGRLSARAASPTLHVTARPRHVRAGTRKRVTFTVTNGTRRIRGAHVRFAGKTHRTGKHGRARFTVRLRARGLRRAVASKKGYRSAKARIRVIRRVVAAAG